MLKRPFSRLASRVRTNNLFGENAKKLHTLWESVQGYTLGCFRGVKSLETPVFIRVDAFVAFVSFLFCY